MRRSGTEPPRRDDAPRWVAPKLTFRRFSGLDRSGPPPPQTLPGAPLNPWTVPNAIGFARLALIPVFLAFAFASDDGTSTTAAILFLVVACGDYADGIAARVTKQFSRLGTLLDPIVDRLLIISGVVVVWDFGLLPRWALALLVVREVLILLAGRYAQTHGVALQVNWLGRWGVWPTMAAIFAALVSWHTLAELLLYAGLVLVYGAALQYAHDARRQLRARHDAEPSSSR